MRAKVLLSSKAFVGQPRGRPIFLTVRFLAFSKVDLVTESRSCFLTFFRRSFKRSNEAFELQKLKVTLKLFFSKQSSSSFGLKLKIGGTKNRSKNFSLLLA